MARHVPPGDGASTHDPTLVRCEPLGDRGSGEWSVPEYGSSKTLAGEAARSCSAVLLTTGWAMTAVVAALTLAPTATRAPLEMLNTLVTVLLPTILQIH